MTDVNVYDAKGAAKGKVSLPDVFATPVRPDLVRKAVDVARANRRQKYGASPMAGRRHSMTHAGKGRGMSRVPRQQESNRGVLAPPNVGGRRAHPPEARRDWTEKINHKERRLAIASALAAVASRELVTGRGHRIDDKVSVPVVVADDIATIVKTKDALALLEKIGLAGDIERARDGRNQRPGIGKMRGRRTKQPKSLLLVTNDKSAARKGFGALPGVDVVTPREISAEALAPGGDIGRLVVFTESALKAVGGGAK